MLTNLPLTDHNQIKQQIADNKLASLLIEEAVTKLSIMTNLNKEQCLALFAAKLTLPAVNQKLDHHALLNHQSPILEQDEALFIKQLFH